MADGKYYLPSTIGRDISRGVHGFWITLPKFVGIYYRFNIYS